VMHSNIMPKMAGRSVILVRCSSLTVENVPLWDTIS
jgi:hypothetical protein